ncbi:MAG: nuclear transport factor 2 family protein [Rectinema sp.]|nr:nuclear transport factor 2 family protein [Rectinema sp.]
MNDETPVDCRIESLEQCIDLWSRTYNRFGNPDWSHILPYYDDSIEFKDSIQELRGKEAFRAMTERLAKRSQDLRMVIRNAVMQDRIIFMEWEMTILFRKTRTSVIYGASRIILNERGKIVSQRDYYDLWGDIFDNVPLWGPKYRRFMRKVFG